MNEFVWYVPETGVQVMNLEAVPWIRPSDPPNGATRRWRRYTPLQCHPALCRAFASMDGSQRSIEDFAAKYGQLTDPQKGEPLAAWEEAIADMRSAVECWDAAQNARVVAVSGEAGVGKTAILADTTFYPGSIAAETSLTPGDDDIDVAVRLPPGNIAEALKFSRRVSKPSDAFEFLASKIGQYILNVRTVVVLNDSVQQSISTNGTRVWLDWGPRPKRLSLRPSPTTLLEAMWVQFGQAVEANTSFRQCRQCRTWFDLSPKAARADKVFCTEACKAKAYRQRLATRDHSEPESGRHSRRDSPKHRGGIRR